MPENQEEEWCEYLSASMLALATDERDDGGAMEPRAGAGARRKVNSVDLTQLASLSNDDVFGLTARSVKTRSGSICESLTSSTGSSPSGGGAPWRGPLGRRSSTTLAPSNNQSEHLFEFPQPPSSSSSSNTLKATSSFREVVNSCLSSPGSSISEGTTDDETNHDASPLDDTKSESTEQPVRPSIVDVDPSYAASCMPVLTSLPSSTPEARTGSLYHAKSPVLSNRKDSQTWQLQDEEFLTSPRLGAARHRSNDLMAAGLSLLPESNNQDEVDSEPQRRPTKDIRAASIDFSYQRPSELNPPLPPPQDSYQRLRAKSFSFSTGYSTGGYHGLPPSKQFGSGHDYQAVRPLHHPVPPPPQSAPSQSGGIRPPRVTIPAEPPMMHYQQQYTPPMPYRRYSNDTFSAPLRQFAERTNNEHENNMRQTPNGRGIRSYSMECLNYAAARNGRTHSIEGMVYPPPPPPQDHPVMSRTSSGGLTVEWPPTSMDISPPLPPDTRGMNSMLQYACAPPEAYYEVEFKRGRLETFAGRACFNPGDFVKVEADRGEDIGKVVKRATDLSQLQRSDQSSPTPTDDPLGRTKRHDLPMKKILCLASPREFEMLCEQRKEEHEVFEVCKSKVRQRLLPMNVIDAEYQFDRHKLTFFFEADRRIDFRELVRDLFAIYKTRIWLQQVVPTGKKPFGEYRENQARKHKQQQQQQQQQQQRWWRWSQCVTSCHFLTPFEMARDEEAAYAEYARGLLPTLLAECAIDDSAAGTGAGSGWKRRKAKKGSSVRVWERGGGKESSGDSSKRGSEQPQDGSSSTAKTYAVRSAARIKVPLDMVLKALDCSVVTSYRSFMKILYENLVVDTNVLFHSNLRPLATETQETLAVRWIVCRCHAPMLSDCDMCLLEYSRVHSVDEAPPPSNNVAFSLDGSDGSAHDAVDGLRVATDMPAAYKVLTSLETKHCPVANRLVRGVVPLGGFLLYRTDCSDVTDVVSYMSLEHQQQHGDRQARAMQQALQQMASAVGRLKNAVDAYYMSLRLETLRSTRWVDNSERNECAVCYRRFHQLTRRRHHCRLCGEVICRDCSVHKDADLPTLGPTLLRICQPCDFDVLGFSVSSTVSGSSATTPTPVHSTAPRPTRSQARQSRRTTIAVDNTKQAVMDDALNATGVRRKRSTTVADAAEGRATSNQPMSCPKPHAGDQQPRRSRWRFEKPSLHTNPVALDTYVCPPERLSVMTPKCKREIRHGWHAGDKRLQQHHRHLAEVEQTNQESEPETSSTRPTRRRAKTRFQFTSTLPEESLLTKTTKAPTLQKEQTNQHEEHGHQAAGENHAETALERRVLEDVSQYQELLLSLCERARDLLECDYAALSLFCMDKQQAAITGRSSAMTTKHYLKAKKSDKLVEVAENMQCCAPVLALQQAVLVLDTMASDVPAIPALDFRRLPIVVGPQRARFYAGVPIVTSRHQLMGALAVFRDEPHTGTDSEDLLPVLKTLARTTATAIDDRKAQLDLDKFMSAPLLDSTSVPKQRGPNGRRIPAPDVAVLSRSTELAIVTTQRVEDDGEWRDIRATSVPRSAYASTTPNSKEASMEAYKQQMRRLVMQARMTQAQMEQNALAMKIQGVTL
ncbi:TPA: hypothetical protein N0F65_001897 [Lagenidium giganteum]|uniref:FYVE-type domain-containing protein n=1 Tax=Lagenidium giganteum TaxID=4803 RepID=A0AAV2YZS9_9STRA|nr:TPA: hypothetical protein N0F65_001897 [Lagenidium giganteum]